VSTFIDVYLGNSTIIPAVSDLMHGTLFSNVSNRAFPVAGNCLPCNVPSEFFDL